jgi:tRNA (cytidine/uridine-2'-O-)-methyltransferase
MDALSHTPEGGHRQIMFHIVLFQPEIPPNTGNIIRLAANAGASLHLVRPLGFELTRKAVRRAGLDYEELASVRVHASLPACLEALGRGRLFSVETGGARLYSAVRFRPGDAFIFGPETRGLPAEALAHVPRARQLTIPMRPNNRSLNLANAAALVVYEAWRQNGFAGAHGPLRPSRAAGHKARV